MVAPQLVRSLLLCALGFSYQAAAVCTRSITAKEGDTCASVASAAGIAVTQFLRSNPFVTSCSQVVAGGSYCIEGTADTQPTPPGITSPPTYVTVTITTTTAVTRTSLVLETSTLTSTIISIVTQLPTAAVTTTTTQTARTTTHENINLDSGPHICPDGLRLPARHNRRTDDNAHENRQHHHYHTGGAESPFTYIAWDFKEL
ncbi:hypothetical protein VTK56DRAFT_9134 [Thermocarpiscus australiensis]